MAITLPSFEVHILFVTSSAKITGEPLSSIAVFLIAPGRINETLSQPMLVLLV
jgi:hypothetical protein